MLNPHSLAPSPGVFPSFFGWGVAGRSSAESPGLSQAPVNAQPCLSLAV